MNRVTMLVTMLLSGVFAVSSASAVTLDTKGSLSITCTPGFMNAHSFQFNGTSSFRFQGQCQISRGNSISNAHYTIAGAWDGTQAMELVTMVSDNTQGTVISDCPANPWTNDVACTPVNVSGKAFETFQLSRASRYPLSAGMINPSQKSALRIEEKVKRATAICEPPQIASPPSWTPGTPYDVSSRLKIVIKHHPKNPPIRWNILWAPAQKPGEPNPTPQQIGDQMDGVTMSAGTTTAYLRLTKAGTWTIAPVYAAQSECEKFGFSVSPLVVHVQQKRWYKGIRRKSFRQRVTQKPDSP